MPIRMSASPTLLALALLAGGGWSTLAGAAEGGSQELRDEHFQAITGALDKDFRLTAARQQAIFAKHNYPDDTWHRKALEWYSALRAKNATKDPAKVAAFDKIAASLRSELDAAEEAGRLPEAVSRLLSAAGNQTTQLVKDIAEFMQVDEAQPTVPRAPERIAIAQGQIQALIESMRRNWAKGTAKIRAADAQFAAALAGDENATRAATMLLFEVVRNAYTAHTALREIATRGQDFGLDPRPVRDFLKAFSKEIFVQLGDWEFNFGDYHPYLKAYANVLLIEAVRQQVPNAVLEDLEGGLQTVIQIPLKEFKTPADREDINQLQIKCWTALLRARLELALSEPDKAKAAKQVEKGLEHFATFRDFVKGQKEMTPASGNLGRAWFLGQLWITAARLQMAKGDDGAAKSLLAEVAANKATVASDLARGWLSKDGGNSAAEWGKPTIAVEPAQAINIAKALRKEASATIDPKLRRAQLMSAAVQLRGGVLGVSGTYADQFIDYAPELYFLYALTLSNLELRYHAALVAEQGLRVLAPRITKDANPWKKGAAWTESGRFAQLLARNAMSWASQLASRAKGSGVGALQSDVIELVKRISPEDAGQSADETLILNDLADKNWERVISGSKEFLKRYPTAQPKAYAWTISAYSGWYDEAKKAKDEARAKQVADNLQAAAGAMASEAKAELDKKPAPDRARDWLRVLSTVQTAKLSVALANEQYTDVLNTFGSEFWKNPPADETLRARVLRGLTTAVGQSEAKRVADDKAKNDPQSLLAAYAQYDIAYGAFRKFLPSIKDPAERERTQRFGKNMVNAFNTIATLADGLAKAPGAPPQLPDIARQSRRAVADLLEPTITEKDKPGTILFCANVLWELDEHERAVRLYELYQKVLDADTELTTFNANPKPVLDAVEAAVGGRPELKGEWAKTRDLVEDRPELKDLIRQGETEEKWGEKKANFSDALASLKEFRSKSEGLKAKLGAEGWAAADNALKQLDKLLLASSQRLIIESRLAKGYRELGKSEAARQIYSELYNYDPANPEYAAAYVDIVIDELKQATKLNQEDVKKARDIARGIRNDAGKNRELYWQASTQVMELSLALSDSKDVNDKLAFDAVNRSSPADDLILPRTLPDDRQTGDAKGVRKAKNALAIELVNRYLKLFTGNGITAKPSFRIDEVVVGDKTWTLFVPADGPKYEGQVVPNRDDIEVTVFVPAGESAVTERPTALPEGASPAPVAPATTKTAP
jgi:hypothetical protein